MAGHRYPFIFLNVKVFIILFKEMLLPRGREDGMEFDFLAVLSPFIMDDAALTADWNVHNAGIWSWCGVRSDEGGMPDSR